MLVDIILLTLPSYPMQLIVVWNLHARKALDSANKDWFQLLNRDIPEALATPGSPKFCHATAYPPTPSIKHLETEVPITSP
eukprot:483634-Pelagomonas_calceolata.AAC.1